MSFQIGESIGDYQIIGILGVGGMGKVYKVKNQISDRIDAIKILLPNLADDAELADRFIREIKVLASLNHPNIAGLRTAFRLENQLLMVMEFVEGTSLDERCKAGPIPLEDAINYIMQALAALGYAHKHGVIHRDIKPANMMLTPEGVVKLMDFGIAKTKSDKKLTQTGTTMGSLYYMSAEQVQGNALDGRSDLYSVGVSLYELVTGTRPFQGKSDFDIMIAQLQQAPLPPIQMMPHLPKALNDIVMISLEKEPAKRFQTAEAFAAALGSLSVSLSASPMQAAAAIGLGNNPPAIDSTPAPASGTATFGSMPTVQASMTGSMDSQPAPEQPVAMGGAVSGSIREGTTLLPPVPPSHGLPAPSGSTGYRGLYMALGALIVVAILAVAALQVPRFLKTHASGDQTAQVATANSTAAMPGRSSPDAGAQAPVGASAPSAVSAPPNPDPNQAVGAFGAGTGVGNGNPASMGAGAPADTTSRSPFPINSVNPGGNATPSPKKAPKNQSTHFNQAAGERQDVPTPGSGGPGEVFSPPAGGGGSQVTSPPTANTAATAHELEVLGDLHTKLAVRAQTANDSVEHLRRQMAGGGNNLRADISSSQTRMKLYIDKSEAALNAGDPVAAKKYMGMAEREIETLEKFFGQ